MSWLTIGEQAFSVQKRQMTMTSAFGMGLYNPLLSQGMDSILALRVSVVGAVPVEKDGRQRNTSHKDGFSRCIKHWLRS